MPLEYEDTVMPEEGPCAQCGVLVDEGDANGPSLDDGVFLHVDCAAERLAA